LIRLFRLGPLFAWQTWPVTFEQDWQGSYWGTSYERLKAVKAKYDPDGLLFVHHGVGSEDWNPDGFTRLAAR
jgi:Berberine and berberine like